MAVRGVDGGHDGGARVAAQAGLWQQERVQTLAEGPWQPHSGKLVVTTSPPSSHAVVWLVRWRCTSCETKQSMHSMPAAAAAAAEHKTGLDKTLARCCKAAPWSHLQQARQLGVPVRDELLRPLALDQPRHHRAQHEQAEVDVGALREPVRGVGEASLLQLLRYSACAIECGFSISV